MERQIVDDIYRSGCTDPLNAVITYQVYVELLEVKHLRNVRYSYAEQLGRMYLMATNTSRAESEVYVPVTASEDISFKELKELLRATNLTDRWLFLAIVSPDSTCVYYRLSEGLVPSQELAQKGSRFTKRAKFQLELNKRHEQIKQAAFLELPLTAVTCFHT